LLLYCPGKARQAQLLAGVTTAHIAGRYEHCKAMFAFEKFGCIKCQQQATVPLLTDKLKKVFLMGTFKWFFDSTKY